MPLSAPTSPGCRNSSEFAFFSSFFPKSKATFPHTQNRAPRRGPDSVTFPASAGSFSRARSFFPFRGCFWHGCTLYSLTEARSILRLLLYLQMFQILMPLCCTRSSTFFTYSLTVYPLNTYIETQSVYFQVPIAKSSLLITNSSNSIVSRPSSKYIKKYYSPNSYSVFLRP